MSDKAPEPLSYATPDPRPRFHVAWGGWAFLIVTVLLLSDLLLRWWSR